MFELKLITKESIPHALEKAERYRLLNEPGQAESICHDILAVEPNNQSALVILILALTDRFSKGFSIGDIQPQDLITKLPQEYDRNYYGGLILERRAKAKLDQGGMDTAHIAFDLLIQAMQKYEKAQSLASKDNNDATLRWNSCARIIKQNKLHAKTEENIVHTLE